MSSSLTAPRLSRRSFSLGSAISVFTVSLTDWLSAQAVDTAPRPMRAEISSEVGKKMLTLYKRAIVEMNDTKKWPLYHPFNWTFQANIHSFPSSTDINGIFDPAQGKDGPEKTKIQTFKTLAMGSPTQLRIWKTCSHYTSTNHFLTWHRMYLYFMERIVEKIVGEPFSMPYWAYTPDDKNQIKLPPSFVPAKDGANADPLFFGARNLDFVRNGLFSPSEASHKAAFLERSWLSAAGGRMGFGSILDDQPHGSIHVAVGTLDGMGSFDMAARDPIFWPHHANIDRLWESWRKPGPDGDSSKDDVSSSPSKADWDRFKKFAFAGPDAQRIEMTVADVFFTSKKLGVAYDKLEPIPTTMAVAGEPEETGPGTTLSQRPTASPQITNKDEPVTITLDPAVAPPVALGFAGKPSTRYTLFVEAEASTMPGGSFEVYVNIPEVTGSEKKVAHYLGAFNFFSGSGHADGAHTPTARFKADISDLVRRGLIDPRAPGQVTFRARYATPKVPVTVKSLRIEAK